MAMSYRARSSAPNLAAFSPLKQRAQIAPHLPALYRPVLMRALCSPNFQSAEHLATSLRRPPLNYAQALMFFLGYINFSPQCALVFQSGAYRYNYAPHHQSTSTMYDHRQIATRLNYHRTHGLGRDFDQKHQSHMTHQRRHHTHHPRRPLPRRNYRYQRDQFARSRQFAGIMMSA